MKYPAIANASPLAASSYRSTFTYTTKALNLKMEIKVQIPFEELVSIIQQLSPQEKDKLKKELDEQQEPVVKKSTLTDLLLKGPVFSDNQIKSIEETRKSINQWRTEPL